MAFSQPTTLPLPASTPVKIGLARQAAYPVWASQQTTTQAYMVNYLSQDGANFTVTQEVFPITPAVYDWATSNKLASANSVGIAGSSGFVVPYPPLAYDAGTGTQAWVYVPDGGTMYMVVSSTGGSLPQVTTPRVTFDVWSAPGEFSQGTVVGTVIAVSTTGSLTTITSPFAGYWIRPSHVELSTATAFAMPSGVAVHMMWTSGTATYATSNTTAGTLTCSAGTATAFLPLVYPVEFANSALPWYSARTTAAAFLGTNVTQVLNKGGTILAGRVSPAVQNMWQVTQSYINGLHPAEKAFLPLETGVYTYCPPSTDLVNFWDYTLTTATVPTTPKTGATPAPLYRLDNDSLVNILFLTPTAVAEVLAVTVDWHLEFRTSSALFPIGISALTLETLHQAQLALCSAGFFFENPEHKSVLAKIIAALRAYAPALIGAVNPMAGKLANVVLNPAPTRTNRMVTTTPRASGIAPRQRVASRPSRPSGRRRQKARVVKRSR